MIKNLHKQHFKTSDLIFLAEHHGFFRFFLRCILHGWHAEMDTAQSPLATGNHLQGNLTRHLGKVGCDTGSTGHRRRYLL